ncbi:hypothetical protein OSH11_23940 [Kaistia dalseonensis]|uniref:Porin n=1 Tax=Kaistia dalseonensis TaxID=410840 RepID=A0ABU0HDL9_9HYPH|nr:hypothetical protein [Kaistia dalseonensis]MCX5497772.1 hypothetical protein [Kaistia dalseonensis]MDQ0440416.1 hypothetical protein [Kaistia dalseonensis]
MIRALGILSAGALLLGAFPAVAADLGAVQMPDGAIAAPTAAPTTTFGIEVNPEFYASSSGSNAIGNYADTAIKASLSHTFGGVWVIGGSLQATLKENDTQQYYAEASAGYKFKFDKFTLTPSVALGDTWDATGLGDNKDSNALYYAFYLAGDLKLNSQWTWNAFNLRYRDAFDYEWITPKVSTGVTYAIDSYNSVYTNAGYSWKDTGSGMKGDKMNIAFGYKRAF